MAKGMRPRVDVASDEALMRQIQAGCDRAFVELTARYRDKMVRLAWRILRHDEDAEDAVQTAFLHIFTGLSKFRFQSTVSTWIYRITFNDAVMLLRKRGGNQFSIDSLTEQHPDGLGNLVWAGQGPEEVMESDEFFDLVQGAFKRLNPVLAMPFELCVLGDMSVQDAATALGLTREALKSRLYRARVKVRQRLMTMQCI